MIMRYRLPENDTPFESIWLGELEPSVRLISNNLIIEIETIDAFAAEIHYHRSFCTNPILINQVVTTDAKLPGNQVFLSDPYFGLNPSFNKDLFLDYMRKDNQVFECNLYNLSKNNGKFELLLLGTNRISKRRYFGLIRNDGLEVWFGGDSIYIDSISCFNGVFSGNHLGDLKYK